MPTSTAGLRWRNSHGTISTNASAQIAAVVQMNEELNQSSSRPRSSTISSVPRNSATRRKPMKSKPAPPRFRSVTASGESWNSVAISANAMTPTGPLISKHQRQLRLSAIQPPSVGPTTGATTTATPNNANAWPRFSGGKESARIDWETGTMPPPPTPCRMRNSSSESRLQA